MADDCRYSAGPDKSSTVWAPFPWVLIAPLEIEAQQAIE